MWHYCTSVVSAKTLTLDYESGKNTRVANLLQCMHTVSSFLALDPINMSIAMMLTAWYYIWQYTDWLMESPAVNSSVPFFLTRVQTYTKQLALYIVPPYCLFPTCTQRDKCGIHRGKLRWGVSFDKIKQEQCPKQTMVTMVTHKLCHHGEGGEAVKAQSLWLPDILLTDKCGEPKSDNADNQRQ